MPQARYRLVDTRTTPYYHCISRCVRRAFLCGFDRSTGKNFDHRKRWILDRIKVLSSIFSIDVCAYAIMSNHFHVVLHVDCNTAQSWSFDEVIERWVLLYKGPEVARRYRDGEALNSLEQDALTSLAEIWRERLANLSWFMRCLNETIARMANAEDNCAGRFWEGRFKSQALLDEAALISCMTYVDLNPIRAGMNKTLEDSEFTSVQERLRRHANQKKYAKEKGWLRPLSGENSSSESYLPIRLTDYFALVDWTGRAIRADKRGAIPAEIQPILQQLGVEETNWVDNTQYFGNRFSRVLGRVKQIRQLARRTDRRWLHGLTQAKSFYA